MNQRWIKMLVQGQNYFKGPVEKSVLPLAVSPPLKPASSFPFNGRQKATRPKGLAEGISDPLDSCCPKSPALWGRVNFCPIL